MRSGLINGGMISLTALAIATGWSGPAVAQDAVEESDEIVVTARKREERAVDVPASVTVIGQGRIEDEGVADLRALEFSVPNLVFTGESSPDNGGLSIRGIAVNSGGPGFEAGAGVYIDGVYQGREIANNRNIVDVARIEVLRGPQGTLFGKNTIAGAINITTIQPSEDFDARFVGRVGNLESRELAGYVSGPLGGGFFGKVTAFATEQGGFYRNEFTRRDNSSEETFGGRAQLRYAPGGAFDATLSLDYEKTDDDYIGFEIVDVPPFDDPFGAVPGERTVAQSDPFSERELWGASLTANWELGGGYTLTSITGYRSVEASGGGDLDRTPLDISYLNGGDENEFLSQELRIVSPADRRFSYVAGVYLFAENVESRSFTTGALDFDGDGVSDIPTSDHYADRGEVETRSFAIFGNADFRATDQLTLSAGIRYNHEEKDFTYTQLGAVSFGFAQIDNFRDSFEDEDISPLLSARYALTDASNIYATVAWGYKSGGWNSTFLVEPDPGFGPEQMINYEIGYRSQFSNGRGFLNFAIFQQDYDDMQVAIFDQTGVSKIQNAASARSRGAELEFGFEFSDFLDVQGGVGYTDAEFEDFPTVIIDVDPVTGDDIIRNVNLAGNPLLQAPKWTGSLGFDFHFDTQGGEFFFAPEISYRDERFNDANNDPFFLIESATYVDARIGWRSTDGRIEIFAYGENLADETYQEVRIVEDLFFGPQVLEAYGPPRRYGVQLSYRY